MVLKPEPLPLVLKLRFCLLAVYFPVAVDGLAVYMFFGGAWNPMLDVLR